MNVLVSACLLGVCCRYDGNHNKNDLLCSKLHDIHLIPVCPEQLGGLKTPRYPAEIQEKQVLTKAGEEVSFAFQKGAEEALKIAQLYECRYAILKAKSPSCGSKMIYDGSFTGTLISGDGTTARLLKSHDIEVYSEEEIPSFLSLIEKRDV